MISGIRAIRASIQRQEMHESFCPNMGMQCLMMIGKNSTRWNSTPCMLQQALKMKVPFAETLSTLSELKQYILRQDEWEKIKLLVEALKPFEQDTLIMSQQGSSTTIPDTAAVYQFMFEHLELIINETTQLRKPKEAVV